jgi:hypothetical protein
MDKLYLQLWQRFTTWCTQQRHGSPSGPRFTLASLGRDSGATYPELSSHFKAAVVKLLIAWVAHESLAVDPDPVRQAHAWLLAEWVAILTRAGIWLTADEKRRAGEVGRLYLLAHAYLAKQHLATTPRKLPAALFFVRPKHHCFDHIVMSLATIAAEAPIRVQRRRLPDCREPERAGPHGAQQCVSAHDPAYGASVAEGLQRARRIQNKLSVLCASVSFLQPTLTGPPCLSSRSLLQLQRPCFPGATCARPVSICHSPRGK